MTIPARFSADCAFCADPVDTRPGRGAYREVSGWEPIRSAGGGNALAQRQTTGRFAHRVCLDVARIRRADQPWTQLELEV